MDVPSPPLRILLVDDSANDASFNIRALRALGRPLVTEVVADGPATREALLRFRPDIILSDFSMPGFSGAEALAIAGEVAPDTPFIYVSGTIGEEMAIAAIRGGAADYVFKDNLRRLQPAIEGALRTAELKRERETIEQALRNSEARFRDIVESSEDWIWERDAHGRLAYSNYSVARMLGHEARTLIGSDPQSLMVEEDRQLVEAALPELVAGKRGWRNWVLRWRHRDGSERLLESTAQPMLDATGAVVGYRGVDRDITLRTQQEEKIRQLARMRAVLSAIGKCVTRSGNLDELLAMTCQVAVEQGGFMAAMIGTRTTDNAVVVGGLYGDGRVTESIIALGPMALYGPVAKQRLGPRAILQGKKIFVHDFSSSDVEPELRETMAKIGVAAQIALPIGKPPWAALGLFSDVPQEFDDDELELLDRLTNEIDHARDFLAKAERLEYLAYHHPVTGFPNRTAFGEFIVPRLARGPHVVVLADIDRFRYFNQSRGRGFGDQLLAAVGARLLTLMPDGGLFSHPGDDAFLFAYPSEESLESAVARVDSLLVACCQSPVLVSGEQVRVKLRASVLLAPAHGDNAESIEHGLTSVLAEAPKDDQLVHAFTDEVRLLAPRRAALERDLHSAVEERQFELFLQPKFHAASQQLSGAEALIRWRHPDRGLVSPAMFIPALEDTGLIIEVGDWIRREALAICRQWSARGRGELRLAVNVSARELRHANFVEDCTALLGPSAGLHGLDVEITESMLMDDIDTNIQVLRLLGGLGCKIAIDDFGTGYSSLSYLSRLPVDILKIDQSFVSTLASNADTLSLVTNVINLAHSLGMTVVAEGVEEEEQAKLLRLLRCDELQGYLLGRPMPVAEFETKFLS